MTVRLREWLRSHPAGRDAMVAASWLLFGLVLWRLGAYRMWTSLAVAEIPPWVFLLTLGGMVAAATQRSRLPFLALAAGAAVAGVDLLGGGSLGVVLAFTDLIYAAVKYGSDRGVWIALRATAVGAVVVIVALVIIRPTDPAIPAVLLQWMLIIAVSGLWGWNVRSEGERTREVLGEQHAQETTVLRDRIAHDLHDLVANQIAVAGLHVEAARLQAARLSEDIAPLELSLDRAKQGTDQAHLQLRKLISVLTVAEELDVPGPVEVHTALMRFERLLPGERALCWDAGAFELLQKSLEAAEGACSPVALRVLEELVMNAAKHGTGDVTVRVERHGDALSVELSHAARGLGAPLPPGSGLGIRGATLLLGSIGGELVSRQAHGVWIARLLIPLRPGIGAGAAVADPPPLFKLRSPL